MAGFQGELGFWGYLAWGGPCPFHPAIMRGMRGGFPWALGTGVGFGLVDSGRLLMGEGGWPPAINDLSFDGGTIEEALGGAALAAGSTTRERATKAFGEALGVIEGLFRPTRVVVSGSVGLSDWIQGGDRYELSPFGEHAGLYGAAALALWPPALR